MRFNSNIFFKPNQAPEEELVLFVCFTVGFQTTVVGYFYFSYLTDDTESAAAAFNFTSFFFSSSLLLVSW